MLCPSWFWLPNVLDEIRELHQPVGSLIKGRKCFIVAQLSINCSMAGVAFCLDWLSHWDIRENDQFKFVLNHKFGDKIAEAIFELTCKHHKLSKLFSPNLAYTCTHYSTLAKLWSVIRFYCYGMTCRNQQLFILQWKE